MTRSPKNKTSRKSARLRPHSYKKLGLSIAHHHHTGRRLPVNCTSYAALFFLLILTGCVMLFAARVARAVEVVPGSLTLVGEVAGPPPATAAEIITPDPETRLRDPITDIAGSCEAGLLLEVFRNDSFAGSALCAPDGAFSLKVSLTEGANELKVRSLDSKDRYAPDSSVVRVYLVLSTNTVNQQEVSVPIRSTPDTPAFIINTEPVQRGSDLYGGFNLKYEFHGGTSPYALDIDWQDSTPSSLSSLEAEGAYKARHTYQQAGQYLVTINGIDRDGNKAFIQTLAIVQKPDTTAISGGIGSQFGCSQNSHSPGCVLVDPLIELINGLWPALIIATLMTLSFWAGEKIIYNRLNRQKSTPAR